MGAAARCIVAEEVLAAAHDARLPAARGDARRRGAHDLLEQVDADARADWHRRSWLHGCVKVEPMITPSAWARSSNLSCNGTAAPAGYSRSGRT
jgi:hypothetical protein